MPVLGALPFVAMDSDGKDYWQLGPESNDWAADNATGRRYAEAFIAAVEPDEFSLRLNRVMQAMVCKGRYAGIETGFIWRIGEYASGMLVCELPDEDVTEAA